ncbi:hypothetical protein Ga0123462_0307 [Mariprofundus ferrinatatus]|uniref:Lipoprotein n=1 Tax=Mariprofundus ferrinatatus TaxID=1921087 RepID=A0A2K8L261_9PROT|nr:hypothetical protein [Mariprofundus ferrinatatus]ATX81182.1 hypothetical protein Ga0123462_0307 [Mariprofundus ferrinatatus]
MGKIMLFMVAGLLLIGCGPKKPNLPEVGVPPKPLVQKGFSFTPLAETGWYIIGQVPYRVALARQGKSTDETHAIQGMVFNFKNFDSDEDFIRAVKAGQAQDTDITDPDRFKVTTHDTVLRPHKGERCAFSHIVTEDHGAVKRSATDGFMILEIYALVCRHPENRSAAVSVDYSQRYYAQNRNSDIESKAISLIDSVSFEPLH